MNTINIAQEDDIDDFDEWTEESFEEEISSALISLYESKITGQRQNHPSQRITEQMLLKVRTQGIYLPNRNRIILGESFDNYYQLPKQASLTFNISGKKPKPGAFEGYRANIHVEEVSSLPKGFHRTGGGKPYRVIMMVPHSSGTVDGRVAYVTIDKEGVIFACDAIIHGESQMKSEGHLMTETVNNTAFTLNYEADRFHSWTIEAKEAEAKCIVGIDREQVKSLLYARSLPTTATGRKRPILHLVAAHRRRIKEGTDIDIDQFLRGVSKVEMNGTVFTINPSKQWLSENSK